MSTPLTIDAGKIHIVNIRTLKGNIECDSGTDVNQVDGHQFSFDLKMALKLDTKLIGLKLQTDIVALNNDSKELPITGSYTHEIIFEVENLMEFILEHDGEDTVHPILGSTLAGIIYSTVRGLIYSRSQGTSLGTVIMPVIAPMELLGWKDPNVGQGDSTAGQKAVTKPPPTRQKATEAKGIKKGSVKK